MKFLNITFPLLSKQGIRGSGVEKSSEIVFRVNMVQMGAVVERTKEML